MAIEVMAEVITARRGPWTSGDLMVLMMLASYADPDGSKIYPRVETLARACRMKVRNTQICLAALRSTCADHDCQSFGEEGADCCSDDRVKVGDGHAVLVKLGEATGRPGLFNEYRIEVERLQNLQGCKICRGAKCGDDGCNPLRRGVQNPVTHIDKHPSNVLDTSSARAAGPVDRPGGARELWSKIERAMGVKFRSYLDKGTPVIEGDGLTVYYPSEYRAGRAQEAVRDAERAVGVPVTIRVRVEAKAVR